ncbi:MAG: thiosulfate oxidation carrier protein SoxY [Bacteriovorax sp.]|nr:thiosulfate oxidation carrier protein SoxY [Rhizobacter sp.]
MTPATRRTVLKQGSALAALVACGLLTAPQARALADTAAFELKTMDEALKALGGTPADSNDIIITSPDIAENGAVVPVAVTSKLPKTQEIYLVVENNPFPLTAGFMIPAGTDAFVSTRVKMGQSANIHAIVKADGKLYAARKETKVTLGGCGG